MTREEARQKAVDAAALALINSERARFELSPHDKPSDAHDGGEKASRVAHDAIAAFEHAMADAGWRMVRVVDKIAGHPHRIPEIMGDPAGAYCLGWNACRAAMLAEGDAGG